MCRLQFPLRRVEDRSSKSPALPGTNDATLVGWVLARRVPWIARPLRSIGAIASGIDAGRLNLFLRNNCTAAPRWLQQSLCQRQLRPEVMITYKQYHIERFEHGPKRWVARITRTDGQNIRTILPVSERPYLDTKPTASAEEAEALAKEGIDFGGVV